MGRSKFDLIVTTLTASAFLFVAGAANAGSHPGGAAQPHDLNDGRSRSGAKGRHQPMREL